MYAKNRFTIDEIKRNGKGAILFEGGGEKEKVSILVLMLSFRDARSVWSMNGGPDRSIDRSIDGSIDRWIDGRTALPGGGEGEAVRNAVGTDLSRRLSISLHVER